MSHIFMEMCKNNFDKDIKLKLVKHKFHFTGGCYLLVNVVAKLIKNVNIYI